MLKLRVLDAWEKLTFSVVGPAFRKLGQSLNVSGLALQGDLTSDDRGINYNQ